MSFKYLEEIKETQAAIHKRVLFLVEGQDDGIFLEQILTQRGEDPSRIQILYVQGIARLWTYLSVLVKSPFFVEQKISHICLIIDADKDFSATEKHAREKLKKAGLSDPSSGSVSQANGVYVGLYILPNSRDNGELEDLIIQTLVDDKRVKDARDVLAKHQPQGEKFKKNSKRVLQISLALSPQDLCAGVGRGIRNGAFNVGLDELSDLNEFIEVFLNS